MKITTLLPGIRLRFFSLRNYPKKCLWNFSAFREWIPYFFREKNCVPGWKNIYLKTDLTITIIENELSTQNYDRKYHFCSQPHTYPIHFYGFMFPKLTEIWDSNFPRAIYVLPAFGFNPISAFACSDWFWIQQILLSKKIWFLGPIPPWKKNHIIPFVADRKGNVFKPVLQSLHN